MRFQVLELSSIVDRHRWHVARLELVDFVFRLVFCIFRIEQVMFVVHIVASRLFDSWTTMRWRLLT